MNDREIGLCCRSSAFFDIFVKEKQHHRSIGRRLRRLMTDGIVLTWRGVQDSTCAAAQAASGGKPPPEACQVPAGSNPICNQSLRQKAKALIGGECRIRTRVGLHPNGFQDRPVMTASVTPHGRRNGFVLKKLPQITRAVNRKALSYKDFRQKGVA